MPYRRNDYSFVVDSSFTPFTMQEMLVPFMAYKDAYEKSEAAYEDLTQKADTFKYLADKLESNPNSEAAKIYKGYADELSKQAQDLAKSGLSMSNRRALTNLKRRYQGEIGRLVQADTAMKEEQNLRKQMRAKDGSMLYATENLDIDDFLNGSNPNLYGVSGNELRTLGMSAGKSAASRVYQAGDAGSTLGGYYRQWLERRGYSKESIDAFRASASAIPELQQAADDILTERGVIGNLTGANLERARQSVLNGIIDGAITQEDIKPVRDEGVMSAAQKASNALGWANSDESVRMHDLQLKMSGYDEDGVYHPENDQAVQKARAIAEAKGQGKSGSAGVAYDARNKEMTMIGAKTGSKYKHQDDDKSIGRPLETAGNMRALTAKEYAQLVDAQGNVTNDYVRNAIGNGRLSDYEIYIIPSGSTKIDGSGWIWDDSTDEDIYVVKPRESKRSATDYTGNVDTSGYGGGTNDIPD